MIRIKFYDNGNMQLDIEKNDFLTANIQFLEFEATDNKADLEDDCVHWFSNKQELTAVLDTEKLFYSKIQNTSMKLDIQITDNNFIQKGN